MAGVANRFPAERARARASNRRERLVSSSLFPLGDEQGSRVECAPSFAMERRVSGSSGYRWYLRQMSRIAGVREGVEDWLDSGAVTSR